MKLRPAKYIVALSLCWLAASCSACTTANTSTAAATVAGTSTAKLNTSAESSSEAVSSLPDADQTYAEALEQINAGSFDEAKALVMTLEPSKERADWIMKLENYKKSLVHMENGELEDAARLIQATGWSGKPEEYLELCQEYSDLRYWTGISGIDHREGNQELTPEDLGNYRIRFKIHDDTVQALYSEADIEAFIDASKGVKSELLTEDDELIIYHEIDHYQSRLNLTNGEYLLTEKGSSEPVIEAVYSKAKN